MWGVRAVVCGAGLGRGIGDIWSYMYQIFGGIYFAQAFVGHEGETSGHDSQASGCSRAYDLAVCKGGSLAQNHSLSGYSFCCEYDFVPRKRASSFSSLNRICLHGPFVSSEHFSYLLFVLLLLS